MSDTIGTHHPADIEPTTDRGVRPAAVRANANDPGGADEAVFDTAAEAVDAVGAATTKDVTTVNRTATSNAAGGANRAVNVATGHANGAATGDATARATGHVAQTEPTAPERIDTLVIGGGQAGLSIGYQLSRRGIPFLIVDANDRIGDAWRSRWDSLRLFTPAAFNGLAGMPFPAHKHEFPTKDAMADYLESYARRFALPVRTGVRIDRLYRQGDRFFAEAGRRRFEARSVVVAMSNYQKPRVPDFAGDLRDDIVQIHSMDYRNPEDLADGAALIVGAGNSGSEIAMELARSGFDVWMSGRNTGAIPFRIEGFAGRNFLVRLVLRFLFHRMLTVDTPIGRKARPTLISQGGPLVRVKPRDLANRGVERVPRTVGTCDGLPLLADDRVLDVANVVWCTGFHPGFSWIDIPEAHDDRGYARHESGIVPDVPGLYFVGLHFLHALTSAMIHGVERDANRIADEVAARVRAT